MAPLRRYLRISKYSVLEVRIYLDNPHLGASWLLNARAPVLPRVLAAVRPLVLPKLREENERVKGKGRKKGVKDVVVEDDFEVSVFLVETSTRHAVLTKQKHLREPTTARRTGAGFDRLTGGTDETAIEVEDAPAPTLRREESDEDGDVALLGVAPATASGPEEGEDAPSTTRRSKRTRPARTADSLFVDSSTDSSDIDADLPPSKRARDTTTAAPDGGDDDDKKKMAMQTRYDGFSIYGRVLCLVVKRRGGDTGRGGGGVAGGGGQAMMEEWIASTQRPLGVEEEGGGG